MPVTPGIAWLSTFAFQSPMMKMTSFWMLVLEVCQLWWTLQKHGREQLPHIWGQRWQPGGATPRLRSGAAADWSNPTSKEWWLHGHRRAERSYFVFKVRRGGGKEISFVQGKEQRLCFAGAAVKSYPMSKIRETQVRRSVLQEGIRGQTHWNHNHRKLVNLITLGPQPCLTDSCYYPYKVDSKKPTD